MRTPQQQTDAEVPTAMELLEASKPLYVKTDVLKQVRVEPGKPRIFETTSQTGEFNRPTRLSLPSVSSTKSQVQIPSSFSAFRQVHEPPPLPPKSDQIRQRVLRMRVSPKGSPPPLPPRKSSDQSTTDEEQVVPPVPKPRLSKMKSTGSNEENLQPHPKPRMIEDCREDEAVRRMLNEYRASRGRGVSATPTSTAQYPNSVSALKRRANARTRSPTVLEEVTNTTSADVFPVMDDCERDYLREAVEQNSSVDFPCDIDDSDVSSPSELRFACKPSSAMASPITDSGLPCSDCDDRRHQTCSNKSEDDGFFDASLQKRDDESGSEPLTSVSNIRLEAIVPEITSIEPRAAVSELERNARVIRWIHGCPTNNRPAAEAL